MNASEQFVLNDTAWNRFWSKVDGTGDCWEWTSTITTNGYGHFRPGGMQSYKLAHRVAWLMLTGGLDPQLEIDHLCKNRACVNPDHMEQVSPAENLNRSGAWSSVNRARMACPRGHEYTEGNTRVYRGRRHCRACSRARDARRRAARRERVAQGVA